MADFLFVFGLVFGLKAYFLPPILLSIVQVANTPSI